MFSSNPSIFQHLLSAVPESINVMVSVSTNSGFCSVQERIEIELSKVSHLYCTQHAVPRSNTILTRNRPSTLTILTGWAPDSNSCHNSSIYVHTTIKCHQTKLWLLSSPSFSTYRVRMFNLCGATVQEEFENSSA